MRVGNNFKFKLDSLGLYDDPHWDAYQAWLATKILMYWQLYDTLEVAIIGSSQADEGIDPSKITGLMAFNLAASGGDLPSQKNMIFHYLLPYCPKIKVICSSLDIGWLYIHDGNFSWKFGVGNSKGFKYDSCHDFWVKITGAVDSLRNLVRGVPLPVPSETLHLGFQLNPSTGWGILLPMPPDSLLPLTPDNDVNYQQNFATIRMIADSLRARRLYWIVVNFPVSPSYRNTKAYSCSGPSWQTAHDILDTLKEIAATNNCFYFYDANNDGNHDYDSADAFDYNHLSVQGAAKLSMRVDSIIHSIRGY